MSISTYTWIITRLHARPLKRLHFDFRLFSKVACMFTTNEKRTKKNLTGRSASMRKPKTQKPLTTKNLDL